MMPVPVIILEDAKWIWQQEEIDTCISLYQEGLSVQKIAERMDEDVDNVALLIIHLGQKGKLEGV